MDLDSDGFVDVLSGSYSRMDGDMAGLFQVLWGQEDGTFAAAETLEGSDLSPLILPPSEGPDGVVGQICTRPTAVDLDGDGLLDVVSGNLIGTFSIFRGTGKGEWSPEATQLMLEGEPLKVPHHSDPFFVDWDGDGDQDLLSGANDGSVRLFQNVGSRTAAKFAKGIVLVEAPARAGGVVLGDAHVTRPQSSARVAAADVDGDGKLDLLVGDSQHLEYAKAGKSEEEVRAGLAALQAAQDAFAEEHAEFDFETASEEEQAAYDAFWQAQWEKRQELVDSKSRGAVWLLLRT